MKNARGKKEREKKKKEKKKHSKDTYIDPVILQTEGT